MAITSIPRSSSSTSPQPHFSSTSSSSTSTIIGSKHNNNISTTTNNTNNTNTTTTSSSTIIPTILCMNFNQDQGCFAISHEQGFLVYNTNPIELRVKRNFTCTPTNTTTTTTINNNNNNNNNNDNNNNNNNRNNSTGSNESSSSTGFYNTTHNQKHFKAGSGISHITMLHRTNYLALVGGGEKPRFPPNKLIIWDDLKRKTSLLLEFNSPVLNVLLSRVRIIVVLIDQIIVYGFAAPPKKFHTYNTINNEFGIADLSINSNSSNNTNFNSTTFTSTSTSSTTTSPSSNNSINETTRRSISPPNSSGSSSNSLKETNSINNNNNNHNNNPSSSNSTSSSSSYQTLAFPGRSVGQIQIVDVGNNNEKNSMNIIKAHKLNIRCLCLNKSGTLVASASITGTLIRIHSTRTTTLLYEFRRGIDKAVITSMKFNHDDSKLAVLSDKHTLHVYNIDDLHNSNTGGTSGGSGTNGGVFMNRHSFLNNLPYLPNYFNSTWSFCSVNTNKYHEQHVNNNSSTHNNKSSQIDEGTIGWSGDDSIIIIWKLKKIWEKYVIVETENHNYELIRSSWKKLES